MKPQFEVGRVHVSRGRGVIRQPDLWRQAVLGVCSALQSGGAGIMDLMASPITGSSGNPKFLLHARRDRTGPESEHLEELVGSIVEQLVASHQGLDTTAAER